MFNNGRVGFKSSEFPPAIYAIRSNYIGSVDSAQKRMWNRKEKKRKIGRRLQLKLVRYRHVRTYNLALNCIEFIRFPVAVVCLHAFK